jgi:hypothetical protein
MVPPDVGLRISQDEIALLNRYSVEVRYPGEWEPVTRADARSAVKAARDLRDSVMAILERLSPEQDPP